MIIRTLNPTRPETVAKELGYGLTDAQVIKYFENIFRERRYYQRMKNEGYMTEELWKKQDAELVECAEIFFAECEKRKITYVEKQYIDNWSGDVYWYEWYKDGEQVFVCEICEKEFSNGSGFCDYCEGQLQELTVAWNMASQKVKDYFREKIEEEYEDD